MSPSGSLRCVLGRCAVTLLVVGSIAGCSVGKDGPSCTDAARQAIDGGAAELVQAVLVLRDPEPLNDCGDDDHAYRVRLDVGDSKAVKQRVAALPGCSLEPFGQDQAGPIWGCSISGSRVLIVFDNTDPGHVEITI